MKYQCSKLLEASAAEAQLLSQISLASKAHWGYPTAWLELWRKDLEVSPAYLTQNDTFVLERLPERQFIGFCIISEATSKLLWVEHLWILPEYIGQGLGSVLLTEALAACIRPEHHSVKVIADPNAAAFYQAKGFSKVAYHPSQPGDRKLPIMEKRIRP